MVLKKLERDLADVERAKDYLDKERAKLMAKQGRIEARISKEKEVVALRAKIEKVRKS